MYTKTISCFREINLPQCEPAFIVSLETLAEKILTDPSSLFMNKIDQVIFGNKAVQPIAEMPDG